MRFNSEEMLCFAAVCKTGSFTAAASFLGCSKSHVSRLLGKLEQQFETKLMARTTRQLHLTEAGESLKPAALDLLEQLLHIEHQSQHLSTSTVGRFRITAPVSMASVLVAPLLSSLQLRLPEVVFDLLPTNENLDLLDAGIDLAVRTGSVVDETLVAKSLGHVRNALFVRNDLAHKYRDITPGNVSDLPLIVNQSSQGRAQLSGTYDQQLMSLPINPILRVQEYPILADLLFDGDYVGWLPEYYAGLERDGCRLTPVLPAFRGQPWPVYLVFPFQTPLPAKLTAVLAVMTSHLKSKFSELDP